SPTLFSVRTSRRLFRGMVHLTESESWRWAFQMILENTRWDLPDEDVERHMAVAFEYVMEMLGEKDAAARRLDPAGDKALRLAKQMRRQALHEGGREDPERMEQTAEEHFGMPAPALAYWRAPHAQPPPLAPSLRHVGAHALGRLLAERAAAHQPDELCQGAGRHAQLLVVGLRVGEDLVDDPVRRQLGVRPRVDDGFIIVGHRSIAGQDIG